MLEVLKVYPMTLRTFVAYLKFANVDLMVFYKMPFIQQLGYFIYFLHKHDIAIEVNHYTAMAYFSQFRENLAKGTLAEHLIIYKKEYEKQYKLEDEFKNCIIESFKRIECPF